MSASDFAGQPDVPENYHTLIWTLQAEGDTTVQTLAQDSNDSEEGAAHG